MKETTQGASSTSFECRPGMALTVAGRFVPTRSTKPSRSVGNGRSRLGGKHQSGGNGGAGKILCLLHTSPQGSNRNDDDREDLPEHWTAMPIDGLLLSADAALLHEPADGLDLPALQRRACAVGIELPLPAYAIRAAVRPEQLGSGHGRRQWLTVLWSGTTR